MKKYFIEITEKDNSVEYVIQSRLFDNEEQAIEWAKGILYLDNRFSVYLWVASMTKMTKHLLILQVRGA